MFDFPTWLRALPLLLVLTTLVWMRSVARRDASLIDPFWSLLFVAALAVYAWPATRPTGPRTWLIAGLVLAWAIRLSAYLFWRRRGHGEDRRYAAMRARHGERFARRSLFTVFWLQAGLAWVISLPLLAAVDARRPLGWLDVAGLLLWCAGMFFQVVGDAQLARFRADPGSAGAVLDRGLWRYTRHPNYFGEACIWWGYGLLAAASGGVWGLVGPLLMTGLLLRVSGVTLLEKDIADRRPAYRDYVQRTNAFFPGPARSRPSPQTE